MVSNKCRIFAEGFLGNVLSNSDNAKTLTILFLFMSGAAILGVRLDKQSGLDILVLTNAHSLIEGRRMLLLLLLLSMVISV